jgi:hypothetical protein
VNGVAGSQGIWQRIRLFHPDELATDVVLRSAPAVSSANRNLATAVARQVMKYGFPRKLSTGMKPQSGQHWHPYVVSLIVSSLQS